MIQLEGGLRGKEAGQKYIYVIEYGNRAAAEHM
jgi:hypothetical protein